MNFKSLIVLALAMIPCASFAESYKKVGIGMEGCNYTDTQIISIKGGSDSSCKSTQLCSGTVKCFTNVSKIETPHLVSSTFPVVCTAKDGACPSVEDCRKPDNAVSFTKEARGGIVGDDRWIALSAEMLPGALKAAASYKYKMAYPTTGNEFKKFDEAIKKLDQLNQENKSRPTGVVN